MTKTASDARKHIKALADFFSEYENFSNEIVDAFLNKHKQKRYLKQSLDRLIKKGFIKKENNQFSLSPKGILRFFRIKNKNQQVQDKNKWDGKWRLISFDVPVGDNSERFKIYRLLREFNFYPLQKSVWVCPNYLAKKFWELIIENKLEKYCRIMLVDIIEGDEDLRKHFKIV